LELWLFLCKYRILFEIPFKGQLPAFFVIGPDTRLLVICIDSCFACFPIQEIIDGFPRSLAIFVIDAAGYDLYRRILVSDKCSIPIFQISLISALSIVIIGAAGVVDQISLVENKGN
jgi:hypothetical protein